VYFTRSGAHTRGCLRILRSLADSVATWTHGPLVRGKLKPGDRWLTVAQAAAAAGVHASTIRRWCDDGRLPASAPWAINAASGSRLQDANLNAAGSRSRKK